MGEQAWGRAAGGRATHPGLDVLGSVGVQQGGPRLLEVRAGWADVGDHHRPAVPPQGVLLGGRRKLGDVHRPPSYPAPPPVTHRPHPERRPGARRPGWRCSRRGGTRSRPTPPDFRSHVGGLDQEAKFADFPSLLCLLEPTLRQKRRDGTQPSRKGRLLSHPECNGQAASVRE